MDEESASADAAVAEIAARQHGIVTVAQLAAVGLSKDALWKRVHAGDCIECIAGCMRLAISR